MNSFTGNVFEINNRDIQINEIDPVFSNDLVLYVKKDDVSSTLLARGIIWYTIFFFQFFVFYILISKLHFNGFSIITNIIRSMFRKIVDWIYSAYHLMAIGVVIIIKVMFRIPYFPIYIKQYYAVYLRTGSLPTTLSSIIPLFTNSGTDSVLSTISTTSNISLFPSFLITIGHFFETRFPFLAYMYSIYCSISINIGFLFLIFGVIFMYYWFCFIIFYGSGSFLYATFYGLFIGGHLFIKEFSYWVYYFVISFPSFLYHVCAHSLSTDFSCYRLPLISYLSGFSVLYLIYFLHGD